MSKCCFEFGDRCAATTYTTCPGNCPFFMTEKQYEEGKRRAEEILKSKGLVAVKKNLGGHEIMTVRKMEDKK